MRTARLRIKTARRWSLSALFMAASLVVLTVGIAAGFGGASWADWVVLGGVAGFLATGLFSERLGWIRNHQRARRRRRRARAATPCER